MLSKGVNIFTVESAWVANYNREQDGDLYGGLVVFCHSEKGQAHFILWLTDVFFSPEKCQTKKSFFFQKQEMTIVHAVDTLTSRASFVYEFTSFLSVLNKIDGLISAISLQFCIGEYDTKGQMTVFGLE